MRTHNPMQELRTRGGPDKTRSNEVFRHGQSEVNGRPPGPLLGCFDGDFEAEGWAAEAHMGMPVFQGPGASSGPHMHELEFSGDSEPNGHNLGDNTKTAEEKRGALCGKDKGKDRNKEQRRKSRKKCTSKGNKGKEVAGMTTTTTSTTS
jgi:hypothetical protein